MERVELLEQVNKLEWMHRIDLGDGIVTPGKWPVNQYIVKAFNDIDFRGKKVLDIGAEIDPECKSSIQFIDGYKWKDKISAINLSPEHISKIKSFYPFVDARVCDARSLPWEDKYFDIVYSNAVIEHLGTFANQVKMASEIMRVGKSWFIATPNRWYPFEFHMRLPFVTWLPCHGYLWVGSKISYNHELKKYVKGNRRSDLRLLSVRELKKCFPGSNITVSRVTFMAETLICIGGHAA